MFIHNTNKLTNAGMNPTCAVPAALELARACVLAMEHERAKLSTSRTGYEESVTFFIQHGRRAFELASYLEAQMRRHHQLQQQRVQGKVAAARTGRDFALWALSCLSDCLATADASHKEALKEQQLSLLQAWRLLFESAGHLKAETLDAETVGLVQEFDSLSRNWNDEISATLRDIQQGKVIRAAEREILEHKMVFKALREGDALMGENNRRAGMGNHWYISFPLPPKPTAFPAYPLPPSSFLSLERGEGFCMYSHSLLTKTSDTHVYVHPLLTGIHARMVTSTPSAIAAGLWWRRPATSVVLRLGALTTEARLEMQRQPPFWTGSQNVSRTTTRESYDTLHLFHQRPRPVSQHNLSHLVCERGGFVEHGVKTQMVTVPSPVGAARLPCFKRINSIPCCDGNRSSPT